MDDIRPSLFRRRQQEVRAAKGNLASLKRRCLLIQPHGGWGFTTYFTGATETEKLSQRTDIGVVVKPNKKRKRMLFLQVFFGTAKKIGRLQIYTDIKAWMSRRLLQSNSSSLGIFFSTDVALQGGH